LEVISKPDIQDWASLPYEDVEYSKHLNLPLSKLKVAYCQDSGPTDKIAQWLSNQGAMVEPVEFGIDIDESIKIIDNITIPESLIKWQNIPKDRVPLVSRKIQKTSVLSHSKIDLHHWIDRRKTLIIKFREFMQHYDVVLCPAATISVDKFLVDDTMPVEDNLCHSSFSVLACMTKQPTITVPIGLNDNSMPEAVQVIGPMHGDVLTLQIASSIESAFPMLATPPLHNMST
jgi:aspartyl-tRNA(Asn)/glutamyl-tRNA(Gln) amidotransferase subunit A